MSNHLALIVDDEPDIRELLEITLARMGVDTRPAGTVSETGEPRREPEHEPLRQIEGLPEDMLHPHPCAAQRLKKGYIHRSSRRRPQRL